MPLFFPVCDHGAVRRCRVQEHGGDVLIPFSGVLEQKLADMPADEGATYCKENDIAT